MRKTFLVALLILVACSSSPGTNPSSDKPANGASNLTVSMELSVPSGAELHQCQLVRLPTDTDVEAVTLSHEYTTGSHHFLLYATDLTSIPPQLEGQFDCVHGDEPLMKHARGILYGAQTPKGQSVLPPGVGLHLKAGQILMIQAHYLNPQGAPIDAKISMSFATAPADKITTEAGFMLFYDPFIYLPGGKSAKSGIRCGAPEAITLISGFSHYHQRGTGMKVWLDGNTSTMETPFFETHDWEHPNDFHGPKDVPAGSTFRVECDYTNPDAADVFQGPNAKTSEMCVFAGLYYPKRSDDFQYCNDMSVKGAGADDCTTLSTCVQACPGEDAPQFTNGGVNVGPCWQRCVAKGCDGATDALLPLLTCVSSQCQAECSGGGSGCKICAVSKCGTQATRCSDHTCK